MTRDSLIAAGLNTPLLYRRRWLVPALAAAASPIAGDAALRDVSLLGYVAATLAVYLLARRRFGIASSIAAGAFVAWFPPLREWAAYPLTDSSGVAALALALLAALWARNGSRSRILVWAASVLLVSLTRNTAIIAVAAATWLALAERTRRATALVIAGAAAALPVPLLFGAPVRSTLAFTFNANRIPADDSWSYVLHRYWPNVHLMLLIDFPFRSAASVSLLLLCLVGLLGLHSGAPRLQRLRAWTLASGAAVAAIGAVIIGPLGLVTAVDPVPSGVLLVAAILPLYLPGRVDPLLRLARGGALGAIAYLFLLPQYTGLRLALVLLPFAALGIARAVELARDTREAHTAGAERATEPLTELALT